VLVYNRPATVGKDGRKEMAGTNDYKIYVAETKGKWVQVLQGWLRPGPGSGGSSASSQYLSFDAQVRASNRYLSLRTVINLFDAQARASNL